MKQHLIGFKIYSFYFWNQIQHCKSIQLETLLTETKPCKPYYTYKISTSPFNHLLCKYLGSASSKQKKAKPIINPINSDHSNQQVCLHVKPIILFLHLHSSNVELRNRQLNKNSIIRFIHFMAERCKLDFSTILELIGKENLVKGWNDLRGKKEEENSAIWLRNNQSIYF